MTPPKPATSAGRALLAYGNGWHGADCAGNFSIDAACSCGLAAQVAKAEAEAAAQAEARIDVERLRAHFRAWAYAIKNRVRDWEPVTADWMTDDLVNIVLGCTDQDTLEELAALSSEPPSGSESPEWAALANDIRMVDGNHDLGAGEIAHRLTERGWTRALTSSENVGDLDAALRRFWALRTMEGSDGHFWVRRDQVSAAIQGLPIPPDAAALSKGSGGEG